MSCVYKFNRSIKLTSCGSVPDEKVRCLIDELSRYLEEEDILTFCAENHITIDKEGKRIDKDKKGNVYINDNIISHSQEMVLWLQIQNENTTKEEHKQITNELFKIYKFPCDRIAHKICNGRMSQDDAKGEVYLVFMEIIANNKFRLHDSDNLYGLMVRKIEWKISNIYIDKYADGISHNISKDKRSEKVIRYVNYGEEYDYKTNQYTSAKDNDDIITQKQIKNSYYGSNVENNAILWATVNSLSEEDKKIFMTYLEGATQEEIAKMKGCSRIAILKRLREITEQLREEVVFLI